MSEHRNGINTDFRFGLLKPQRAADANKHNAAWLSSDTLGIEVTEAALAACCGLGNIDPQHLGRDAGTAAIEAARDWPLPPRGAALVTLRPDADAIGAMALLALRQSGAPLAADALERIALIGRADRFDFGPWPGPRRLPVSVQDIDEVGVGPQRLGAMIGGLASPDCAVEAGVRHMMRWIVTGEAPGAWVAQAEKSAEALLQALSSGAVTVREAVPGRVALVEGFAPGALRLGYRLAPVVVAVASLRGRTGDIPVHKITIAQFRSGYVDLHQVARTLSAAEPGWGGSPTIIGSPQGISCRTSVQSCIHALLNPCVHDLMRVGGTIMASAGTGAGAATREELKYAYLFEAKGIQKYIFASGRLRDVVGASDLLARIASNDGDLVAVVEAQVPPRTFSRRAGGAFCAHFATKDELDRFRGLWRLTLATALPGLEFADAVGEADKYEPPTGKTMSDPEEKALLHAYEQQSAGQRSNSAASVLPLGGPATKFAPRTGRPAVPPGKSVSAVEHPVDMILKPIRERADETGRPAVTEAENKKVTITPEYDALAKRILPQEFASDPEQPKDGGPPLLLPRNLSNDMAEEDKLTNPLFAFIGDLPRLAIVHADLSGLGELYRAVTGGPAARLKRSHDIEQVVFGAISAAVSEILAGNSESSQANWDDPSYGAAYKVDWSKNRKFLANHSSRVDPDYIGKPGFATVRIAPFRPIVAGGDDITFLVRSDLALRFIHTLLKQIEAAGQPLGLSACAGIALVKATTPFLIGHDLAEQLCSFAKKAAKHGRPAGPYPSALAFHEPTGSLGERYSDTVLPNELTAGTVRLTAGPYGFGATTVGRPLDALLLLVAALKGLRGRGALRELRTRLVDGKAAAEADWRRWRTVQIDRGKGSGVQNPLDALDGELKRLGVADPTKSFLAPASGEAPVEFNTALFDALTLLSLQPRDREGESNQAPAIRAQEPVG